MLRGIHVEKDMGKDRALGYAIRKEIRDNVKPEARTRKERYDK